MAPVVVVETATVFTAKLAWETPAGTKTLEGGNAAGFALDRETENGTADRESKERVPMTLLLPAITLLDRVREFRLTRIGDKRRALCL
jgi:hypothetical protein